MCLLGPKWSWWVNTEALLSNYTSPPCIPTHPLPFILLFHTAQHSFCAYLLLLLLLHLLLLLLLLLYFLLFYLLLHLLLSLSDGRGNWSTSGCNMTAYNSTRKVVFCECDHLTSFACLVVSSDTKTVIVIATFNNSSHPHTHVPSVSLSLSFSLSLSLSLSLFPKGHISTNKWHPSISRVIQTGSWYHYLCWCDIISNGIDPCHRHILSFQVSL